MTLAQVFALLDEEAAVMQRAQQRAGHATPPHERQASVADLMMLERLGLPASG